MNLVNYQIKHIMLLKEKYYICASQVCYIAVVVKQQKEEVDLSASLAECRRAGAAVQR